MERGWTVSTVSSPGYGKISSALAHNSDFEVVLRQLFSALRITSVNFVGISSDGVQRNKR
jgi:hypothetical protein